MTKHVGYREQRFAEVVEIADRQSERSIADENESLARFAILLHQDLGHLRASVEILQAHVDRLERINDAGFAAYDRVMGKAS